MQVRITIILSVCLLMFASAGVVYADNSSSLINTISAKFNTFRELSDTVDSIETPDIETPEWLQSQIDAENAAAAAAAIDRAVTYNVISDGNITTDFAQFKTYANQTLNDNRGWSRLGLTFTEVSSGGEFTLVLSEASHLPNYNSICSADWSCQVGNYVIINQDRWMYATDAWNSGGGSLRDYQHMVVNHETGHWLGQPHAYCGGTGQAAPIMQQQSMNLQGCTFNPWPLSSELWSTKLGIYL